MAEMSKNTGRKPSNKSYITVYLKHIHTCCICVIHSWFKAWLKQPSILSFLQPSTALSTTQADKFLV